MKLSIYFRESLSIQTERYGFHWAGLPFDVHVPFRGPRLDEAVRPRYVVVDIGAEGVLLRLKLLTSRKSH